MRHLFDLLARLINQKGDPISLVSSARLKLPPRDLAALVAWLAQRPRIARSVFAPLLPPIEQLHERPTLRPVDLGREFTWVASQMLVLSSSLAEFVALSDRYHSTLFTDEFGEANAALDDIQSEFGASLWLIKNRIYLLQAWKGLDAQKQYSEGLWRNPAIGVIPRVVAYLCSVRNEPSITPTRYASYCRQYVDDLKWPKGLSDYIRFHSLPRRFLWDRQLNNLLRIEHSGCVVDTYESLVTLSAPLLVAGGDEVAALVAEWMPELVVRTKDRRLRSAAAIFGGHPLPPVDPRVVECAELLLSGNAAASAEASLSALGGRPLDSDLWFVAARACAVAGSRAPHADLMIQRLALAAGRALRGGADSTEDIAFLEKTAQNLFGSPLSTVLLGVIHDVTRDTMIDAPENDSQVAALESEAVLPLWFPMLWDKTEVEALGELAQDRAPNTALADLAGLASGTLSTDASTALCRTEALLVRAHRHLLQGEFRDARSIGVTLIDEAKGFFDKQGARITCGCLLADGDVAGATALLTSFYIRDPSSHLILPLRETCVACKRLHPIDFAGDISVPILFDLYSRHVDRSFDSQRSFAYRDFLKVHSLRVPTGLAAIRNRFDHVKVVYFLRHIAVESVLERSMAFRSSVAVIEERLAVCRLLLELDPSSAELYQGEIRTILRRLMLQKRMRQIEQRKIHIDLESFQRTAAVKYREGYRRLLDLMREHPDEAGDSARELMSAFRKYEAGDTGDLINLRLPARPTSELLRDLVVGLRDEYAFSPDHGLDKYLSVRIRHGTLAAQLRRPVENAHLVTTRETASGRYAANAFWRQRSGLESDVFAQVDRELAGFSAAFDRWIADFISVIQVSVSGDAAVAALFRFPISDLALRLIESYISVETSFEQFVDIVVGKVLVPLLDTSLDRARSHIAEREKRSADRMLSDLATRVTGMGSSRQLQDMGDAIRGASTELQFALERTSAWFYRTDEALDEPISVADAITISAEAVQAMSPTFAVIGPGPEASEVELPGRFLATLVDVFFIIFENVVRHSMVESPTVTIRTAFTGDGLLSIELTNAVEPGVVSATNQARITRIREDMNSPDHLKFVSREGGSGFHKLKKILSHDLGVDGTLEFGFGEAGDFGVRFAVRVGVPNEDTSNRG